MRIRRSCAAVALGFAIPVLFAQEAPAPQPTSAKAAETKASETTQPKEETSTTDHMIRLGTQTIAYKATASTTLLKNDKDEPVASIFSVAYTRSDIKEPSQRAIAFIYNGGPGNASVWLHMGAFGPRRVVTQNAAPTGAGPYELIDNANCLLDKSDLVFIDPVGTGFSRVVGKGDSEDYWGVDQDVNSLAEFIGIYISGNGRWNSPKFLIGESSVALANYLQTRNLRQWHRLDLYGIRYGNCRTRCYFPS